MFYAHHASPSYGCVEVIELQVQRVGRIRIEEMVISLGKTEPNGSQATPVSPLERQVIRAGATALAMEARAMPVVLNNNRHIA